MRPGRATDLTNDPAERRTPRSTPCLGAAAPVGRSRGDERGLRAKKVRAGFEPAQALCVSAADSRCTCAAAPCPPPRSHTQLTVRALASSAGPVRPSRCSTSSALVPEYSGPGRRHLRGGAARAAQLTHLPRLRRRRWRPAEEGLRVGSGCWAGAEPAGARPTGRARGACGSARGGEAAQGGARPRTAIRNE